MSEASSTIGPKPRPILGLFTPQSEIRREIKSGSIALGGREGGDEEKDTDLQCFFFSVVPSQADRRTYQVFYPHSPMAGVCTGLL